MLLVIKFFSVGKTARISIIIILTIIIISLVAIVVINSRPEIRKRVNIPGNVDLTDTDTVNLLSLHPDLPLERLLKVGERTTEDSAGNEHRAVSFALIEGDIAKQYQLTHKPDGTFSSFKFSDCDSQEFDPRHETIFREVSKKVSDEMERENISGLGSCHTYWRLKTKYLKARGIDWRSPEELNPSVLFD